MEEHRNQRSDKAADDHGQPQRTAYAGRHGKRKSRRIVLKEHDIKSDPDKCQRSEEHAVKESDTHFF